jgi:GT2 family glycosyltransferase
MGISFLVTAYNEYEELKRLLNQLLKIIKTTDELVIQLDNKATTEVITLVDEFINTHSENILIKKCHFGLKWRFCFI